MDTNKQGIKTCCFCKSQLKKYDSIPRKHDLFSVECPCCGYYRITDSAKVSLNLDDDTKIIFSGYLRKFSTLEFPLTIAGQKAEPDWIVIEEIGKIVYQYKKQPVTEKVDNLLRYIGKNTKALTDYVRLISADDFTLFFMKNSAELEATIRYFSARDLIKERIGKNNDTLIELTVDGWKRYEELKQINDDSRNAFVALKFKTDFKKDLLDVIEKACDRCGYKASAADSEEYNEKICDWIIANINQSRFIVADVTGDNPGVHFEAGYAMGLGLSVIWTIKKGETSKLHFDTRQYKHIEWDNFNDLEEKLVNRIKATIR